MQQDKQCLSTFAALQAAAYASGTDSPLLYCLCGCSWIEGAPHLLRRVRRDGVLGSGGSIAPLASGIAHSCLELGLLQQHLHGVIRPSLQSGCEAVCQALRRELPSCTFQQPEGGYFVWVTLPEQVGCGNS